MPVRFIEMPHVLERKRYHRVHPFEVLADGCTGVPFCTECDLANMGKEGDVLGLY